MSSVIDVSERIVARFDFEQGDIISNLKLQKLLYYAQGWSLALHERPLFDDRLEAWRHGPVAPDAYRHFKRFGNGAILLDHVPELERDDLLEAVVEVYGSRSAGELRNRTHHEPPWRDCYQDGVLGIDIPNGSLREYFATQAGESALHRQFLDRWVELHHRVMRIDRELIQELAITPADRERVRASLGLH